MRIAIFYNLPSGGGKRALFEWTRRLASRHEIDVYSLRTADHDFCDLRPYVSQYKIYEFTPRVLLQSPFGRLNQFQRWRDLRDLEKLNRQIAREINAGGYDVLFANSCIYTIAPPLLQFSKIPSVYYSHEAFGAGSFQQFERPYISKGNWRKSLDHFDPLIRLYQHRLRSTQKRNLLKATELLTNSEFTCELAESWLGRQVMVSPCGVDVDIFYPMMDIERDDFVVSVGEMSPRKGFDFIVESLGRIPEDCRPALKLACNVVHEDELRYVKDLAEQKRVQLDVLVGLSAEELRLLYNQARLCVYAPVMEPFGLVPLEAMACGTPVIGVSEGGVRESVVHEQTGWLVKRDAQQFGEATQRLLSDPDRAAVYGQNAREYVVKNWTWERSVSTLTSHLADCAGRNDELGKRSSL